MDMSYALNVIFDQTYLNDITASVIISFSFISDVKKFPSPKRVSLVLESPLMSPIHRRVII